MLTRHGAWTRLEMRLPESAYKPLGFAAGDTNLYRYVGNDPTNRIDPSGLLAITFDGTSFTEKDNSIIQRIRDTYRGGSEIYRFSQKKNYCLTQTNSTLGSMRHSSKLRSGIRPRLINPLTSSVIHVEPLRQFVWLGS